MPTTANPHLLLLQRAIFLLAAVFTLTHWASPAIALALGIALALTLGNPFPKSARTLSRYLLQFCVVLLGFSMDLNTILRVGAQGAVMAAVTITATIALGLFLGRRLRIDLNTSTLISGGTAICGGSAIAALASVIGAAPAQVAVATGAVFILNAVALYTFPIIGHALELTQQQFGIWAGVAIHDVSSVVAAGKAYGEEAQEIATAVKLSRVLWIIPLCLIMPALLRRLTPAPLAPPANPLDAPPAPHQSPATAARTAAIRGFPPLPIPWFIALFLLASLSRSFIPVVADAAPTIKLIATRGLALTLFLIGSGITLTTLKSVGPRALFLAIALWLFISAASLISILAVGRLSEPAPTPDVRSLMEVTTIRRT